MGDDQRCGIREYHHTITEDTVEVWELPITQKERQWSLEMDDFEYLIDSWCEKARNMEAGCARGNRWMTMHKSGKLYLLLDVGNWKYPILQTNLLTVLIHFFSMVFEILTQVHFGNVKRTRCFLSKYLATVTVALVPSPTSAILTRSNLIQLLLLTVIHSCPPFSFLFTITSYFTLHILNSKLE